MTALEMREHWMSKARMYWGDECYKKVCVTRARFWHRVYLGTKCYPINTTRLSARQAD